VSGDKKSGHKARFFFYRFPVQPAFFCKGSLTVSGVSGASGLAAGFAFADFFVAGFLGAVFFAAAFFLFGFLATGALLDEPRIARSSSSKLA